MPDFSDTGEPILPAADPVLPHEAILRRMRWRQLAMRGIGLVLLAATLFLAADVPSGMGAFGGAAEGHLQAGDRVRFDLEEIAEANRMVEATGMEFLEIPRDRARRLNAAVPFSTAPNPAARPFRLGGDTLSQARAVDCLAAAQYYEAGSDIEGQRAVAQVVLNRVRHPAYPGTVCGVVFQGSERRTGCQFTFTCDGAMIRRPVPSLWLIAQTVAREALTGRVYAKVGLATHYHTDWVVPVWSGSLDKITNVDTHLFFRWKGSWGQPRSFSNELSQTEPVVARMAGLSEYHSGEPSLEFQDELEFEAELPEAGILPPLADTGTPLPSLTGVNLRGSQLRLAHPSGDAFGFLLSAELPGSFGLLAYDVCRGRDFCKVMGWTDPDDIPRGYPIPFAAQEKLAFLYIYDRATRNEIMAWNCEAFPRRDPQECLTAEMTRWDAVQMGGN